MTGQLSRPVLRGRGSSNASPLPDYPKAKMGYLILLFVLFAL